MASYYLLNYVKVGSEKKGFISPILVFTVLISPTNDLGISVLLTIFLISLNAPFQFDDFKQPQLY